MRTWLKHLAFFITMALSSDVTAQSSDSVRLSLEEAITRALAAGEEMKIASAQVDFAESQIARARADALPQIEVALGYNRQIESVFRGSGFGGSQTPQIPVFTPNPSAPIGDRVTALEDALPTAGLASLLGQFSDSPFGRLNTWNAGFTVTQTLFDGNRLWTAPRVAGRVRDVAEARYREQRADVVLNVRRAYYGALLAEQTVIIARLSLEQAERQLEHVRRQHREGVMSDFELLQAEVQRDNQTPALVEAETQSALALLSLKKIINLPSDAAVRLVSTWRDPLETSASPALLSTLLERSRNRPALEAGLHEIEARKMAVGVARSDLWPKISFVSNYNRQAFPTGLFPGRRDWRTDWSIGFNFRLNLFDGLRTRASIQEARANLDLAQEQMAQTQEDVALGVEKSYQDMLRVRAQIEARARTVGQAERALRLAEIRYEEGVSTALEVSDARLQLQRARMNHAQAIYDYNIALAELERAAYTEMTEDSTR
jgi:outer membrane protein TolC